jgi:hypothetical protein
MMTPDEIQALNETNAKVSAEAQRLVLTARIDRLRDHIERLGVSPGFESAFAKAEAQLTALGPKGAA